MAFRTAKNHSGLYGRRPRIAEPVSVEILVAGANLESDADNHSKQVLDALVTAGILKGDSLRIVRRLLVALTEGPASTSVRISRLYAYGQEELLAATIQAAADVWGVARADLFTFQRSAPEWHARAAVVRRMRTSGLASDPAALLLGRSLSAVRLLELRLAAHAAVSDELRDRLERFEGRVDELLAGNT